MGKKDTFSFRKEINNWKNTKRFKDKIIKSTKNIFKQEKENKRKIKKEAKDGIIQNIRNIFKLEKKN